MSDCSLPARRVFKLDELGSVARGRSRHRPRDDERLYGGPYPFFQTGDVKAANLTLSDHTQTYSAFGLAQSKLWEPETLCITIAANIAESAILGVRGCFPDSVVGFIADPSKSDVRFVKYYIDTAKTQMQSLSRGTTQDNMSLEKLLAIDFLMPPIDEQRRIASILSAYDDLIENCQRRIRILEDMARGLYREWFVHFRFPGADSLPRVDSPLGPIPQGWEVRPLRDLAAVNRRQVNARSAPDEIHYIDIASVSPGSIDAVTTCRFSDAPGRARRVVAHGDVLWSCVRPNRRSHALVMSPATNTIASTGFAVLSPAGVPYAYLYNATTTDDFVAYLTNHATGAAYPAVTATTFEDAALVLPDGSLLAQYESAANPIYEMAHGLRLKITNLRRTRDLLLPRLMSGQIDVSPRDTEDDESASAPAPSLVGAATGRMA